VKNLTQGKGYRMGATDIRQIDNNKAAMALRLFQTVGLISGKPPLDLEEIFDFIHKSAVMNTSKDTIKSLLWMFRVCEGGQDWNFDTYRNQFSSYSQSLDMWMDDFRNIVLDLRRKMYEAYLIDPENTETIEHAKASCESALKLFGDKPATIFTTNYDTIFESLRDNTLIKRPLVDGFGNHRPPRFDFQNYLSNITSDKPIYYFKLHGSVTWQRRRDGVIRDLFPTVPKDVALLEPVISKEPTDEPFTHLYSIFERVIAKNSIAVFIGFSFRDDRVRNIVLRRLSDSHPFTLIIVAPEDKNHPQLNQRLEDLAKKPNVSWIKGFWGTKDIDLEVRNKVEFR
jgi:hypothetical protein